MHSTQQILTPLCYAQSPIQWLYACDNDDGSNTKCCLCVCARVYTGVLNIFSHNGFLSIDFNDDGNDEGKRKQVEMVKLMRFRK